MKTHTDYQTIDYKGKPAFVLIPWEEFKRVQNLLEADKACATAIPQEIVEAHVLNNVPMIRAWREYMGITQGVPPAWASARPQSPSWKNHARNHARNPSEDCRSAWHISGAT